VNPAPNPLAPNARTTRKLPWWTRLPGMDWRDAEEWPDMQVANAVCAMACTARIIKIGSSPRRERAKRTADDTNCLRDWLDKAASDKDAYVRRVALCLAADVAESGDNPKWVLEWAQSLHRS
jgi:hypothetical protein